jgi:hypothetical protein
MARLYGQLAGMLGEPEDLWVYDPLDAPQPNDLLLVHVAVWPAQGPDDVNEFNTLGMSEQRMTGADHFVELHLSRRGPLAREQREEIARYLANLVMYPFVNNLRLGPWEVIPNAGRIPGCEGCRHLLLCPQTAPNGIAEVDDPEGTVRLLFVVPITPREREVLRNGAGRPSSNTSSITTSTC